MLQGLAEGAVPRAGRAPGAGAADLAAAKNNNKKKN